MSFRINTNIASAAAQRTLGNNSEKQADTIKKLSSGSRITSSKDDAAGLAISEKLKATIRGTNQAIRNASDGNSMIQVAEGALDQVSSILVRLRELSVAASTDTMDRVEKSFTNLEFQNLKDEINRITSVTEFNGKRVLTGEGEQYDFQVGVNNDNFRDRIQFNTKDLNASLDSLGIEELDVSTKSGAHGSLEKISKAIERVAGQRAELGAKQNRLESTIANLQISSENLSNAKSRISDADFAKETSENARLNILNQAGTSVLAQANNAPANALKLIG